MKPGRLILLLVLIGALGAGGFLYFRDTDGPRIEVSPETGAISAQRSLAVRLTDSGAGLKSLRAVAVQGNREFEVASRDFGAGTATAEEALSLADAGLQEGPFELRLTAADRSIFHFGQGNTTERSFSFDFDNKPPTVSVLTTAHNLSQGGAGLVVYTVSEKVDRTGVAAGGLFFPGYRQPSGAYACLFAFPYDMAPADFVPKVVAVDAAGNERMAGIYYHLNPRSFPTDRINLSQQFLESKIAPDFKHYFPSITDPLELFLKVNGELRAKNTQDLADLGQKSAAQPLWEGVFLRQPNAAVPGYFAQARTYIYEGRDVDHQTHLGIDLASLAHAPVPAANAGTVVYAEELGIYGNCVVIDHGLGLQTLYGHLSQIDVQAGQSVGKGEIIGRTGATGLAGGDHLHFSVLVSGHQANPLEWWDPNWLKNNITDKLALAAKGEG